MKKIVFIIILLSAAAVCFAQSSLSRGEELLMQNEPVQAVTFLEIAVAEENTNVRAWLMLGVAYEQLDRMEEAIAIYRRALPIAGNLSANVAANLGNVYFRMGDTAMAEQFFSQALTFNPVYSSALLGRANTRVLTGDLRNAVADYQEYLSLEPRSPQRANIEQLITVIRSEFAAEEMRRIMAEEEERRLAVQRQLEEEERQRAEELRRIAAEEEERRLAVQRQLEEEERQRAEEQRRIAAIEEERRLAAERQRLEEERQRLLESVSATLQAAADLSQALSSGAEGVESYDGEFELD